jgi:predicted AlkP superfamily phosphohydrolase/phosphomutase
MHGRTRSVIIGLDGATWELLDRWIERGLMPNLAKLAQEGARGALQSVTPPMTATAWTSFMTGKGPGKHGVYDWTEPVSGSYLYRPIDSTRVKSRTFFEYLSELGFRVASVNLPLTWPARSINGIAIGDMLTPSKETPGFTWPPEFKKTLDSWVPGYVIDTHLCEEESDLLPFLERLYAMIRGKAQAIQKLMQQESWDVFCAVWVEMDRMQHCLWHIFDDRHPKYDAGLAAKYQAQILAVYTALDTEIGKMVAAAPKGSNILFLSDHGFGYCRYKVFLNTWLSEEGFLRFQKGGHQGRARLNRVRAILDRNGIDTRKILGLARKLGAGKLLMREASRMSRFAADIDWAETQAFCHGTNAIRINLKGREPGGSVDPVDYERVVRRLKERLLAVRDPEGNPVITKVLTREELYTGPEVLGAADLLIAEHDDSVWFYYSEGEVPEVIFEPAGWSSGNHKPSGFWLGWGPDFVATQVEGAHINDVMPTLLATLGVPIPDDVDGRALVECFKRGRGIQPLYKQAEVFVGTAKDGERSREMDAAIEERLKGLGYLQ